MDLKSISRMVIAVSAVLLVFYSMGKLICFLSYPNQIIADYVRARKKVADRSMRLSAWSLLVDSALILLFGSTHSAMALPRFKRYLYRMNLDVMAGSLYATVSAVTLLALTNHWEPVSYRLWAFDPRTGVAWWAFVSAHAFAWIIVYGGSVQMDLGEILGIKQVYYSVMDFPPPSELKSPELKEFQSHLRHPSFTAIAVLLWTCPVMSLDRLLLATMLTTYMLLAWKTTDRDYEYARLQYDRKRQLLRRKIKF